MSGVGEAAAILQLVQLGAVVVDSCYTYLQSARNAPAEITRTISEVNSLKGILEHLQRLVSEGTGPAALGSLMSPQGPFEASTTALEELAKKLKTLNEASAVRRRLLWPVEGDKFEEILQALEKHKTTFILALAGDNFNTAQKTELGVQEVKTSIEELRAKEKRRSILRWLKDADPTSNHRAARKKHEQPETGTWLLKCREFAQWCDQEGQILWMHGIPGAGKTVLR
jgi:Fungal N-terminal domain of STAND proteins